MQKKHNFVELAEVQRAQGSLYCAGLDIHPFGSLDKNLEVYESAVRSADDRMELAIARGYYYDFLSDDKYLPLSLLLASIELYLKKIVNTLVNDCNIRVFKPQSAFYEQFGPIGMFLLARISGYIKHMEKKTGSRLIQILDCKRGDIDTTQAAYFTGLMGNLNEDWGIDYAPFDFDIINVTPWMGRDVLCLGTVEKPGIGLKLMQSGKGIIVVNKTSNSSGPDYQELLTLGTDGSSLQMMNVSDTSSISKSYDLEYDGLSSIGLVVGSTHTCDGSIRQAFPSTTLLVPGFGAQGGKFSLIMPELIKTGKWNGQGAIFSSSRGTMYPWLEKLGGSGKVDNLETDLINAISKFRANEKAAYETPDVQKLGIRYPFK